MMFLSLTVITLSLFLLKFDVSCSSTDGLQCEHLARPSDSLEGTRAPFRLRGRVRDAEPGDISVAHAGNLPAGWSVRNSEL